VADLRVKADPAFRNIAVTAEQWLPMQEVPEAKLPAWLAAKQEQVRQRVRLSIWLAVSLSVCLSVRSRSASVFVLLHACLPLFARPSEQAHRV
jgi:hypothetical protein